MIGEVLARKYRILRLVSEGGMGSVHEAERVDTGERVAVKLIRQGRRGGAAAEATRRFRREARAAAAASGDNIVQIVEDGIDDRTGDLFIVMELLEGEDLQQMIQRSGPLPPDLALRIGGQALLGLRRAHESGVIHRDIKPGNLFLARGGGGDVMVKILDFGIAKIRGDGPEALHTTGLTASGNFLGSPLYMSPEQVKSSKHVDHRTDLWSIGCVLYCALTGRAPHKHAPSVGELILAICHAPARPVHEVAPWVSPAVSALVQRALAIDPRRRYASASEMLDALHRLAPDLTLREEMWADLPVLQPLPPPAVEDAAPDTRKSVTPELETVRVGAPGGGEGPVTEPSASPPDLVDTPSSTRSRESLPGASSARPTARRLWWGAIAVALLAAGSLGALELGRPRAPGDASLASGAGPPPPPAAMPAPSDVLPVPASTPGAVLSPPDAARPAVPASSPAAALAAPTADAKASASGAKRTSPAADGALRAPEPGSASRAHGEKPGAKPGPLEDELLHEHR